MINTTLSFGKKDEEFSIATAISLAGCAWGSYWNQEQCEVLMVSPPSDKTMTTPVLTTFSGKKNRSEFGPGESATWAGLRETLKNWEAVNSQVQDSLLANNYTSLNFEPICFVNNQRYSTQTWILMDEDNKTVCFAFRGTETSDIKDIWTDAKISFASTQHECCMGSVAEEPSRECNNFMVHRGFLMAAEAVGPVLARLVLPGEREKSIIPSVEELHAWKFYVTGHSLGGALATVFALYLSRKLHNMEEMNDKIRHDKQVVMYSFGSPRVGDKLFKDEFDKHVPYSWRIFNSEDIVSTVPSVSLPLFRSFEHVGHGVMLDDKHGLLVIVGQAGEVKRVLRRPALSPADDEPAVAVSSSTDRLSVELPSDLKHRIFVDSGTGWQAVAPQQLAIAGSVIRLMWDRTPIRAHSSYMESFKQLLAVLHPLSKHED